MSIIKNYQSAKGTCKVTFSYPLTEGIETVQVLGDFNDWDSNKAPKMKKSKAELSTIIELAVGRDYSFRYLLDGNKWDNDNSADRYMPSPFAGIENSVIVLDNVVTKVAVPKAPKTKEAAKVIKAVSPKVTKPATKAAKATTSITVTEKAEKAATSKVTKAAAPVKTVSKVAAKAITTKTVAEKVAKVVTPKVAKPEVAKSATKSKNDDLKKIEGIGPKIATLLNEKGIVSFGDLAKAKIEILQNILDAAGPKYNVHNPSTWSKQAALAAKGNWDALKVLQDELNGGKSAK